MKRILIGALLLLTVVSCSSPMDSTPQGPEMTPPVVEDAPPPTEENSPVVTPTPEPTAEPAEPLLDIVHMHPSEVDNSTLP
ncbi:MAG: hypothetical protein GTO63_24785, partial [Anaerolineae bacterium]|nr:hypothetical protein [Anaerolineae bacterium]NIN97943.1 hypothetical protein [Anaerolineae bacterium]NIQ80910.1 hypothetical protein [Anaerolineae bacterium]